MIKIWEELSDHYDFEKYGLLKTNLREAGEKWRIDTNVLKITLKSKF